MRSGMGFSGKHLGEPKVREGSYLSCVCFEVWLPRFCIPFSQAERPWGDQEGALGQVSHETVRCLGSPAPSRPQAVGKVLSSAESSSANLTCVRSLANAHGFSSLNLLVSSEFILEAGLFKVKVTICGQWLHSMNHVVPG